MDKIVLKNTLPDIFKTESGISSDIWQHEVEFSKGKSYLIQANSGTGKSSLCSYIYGYRADYSGEMFFDKDNIRKLNDKEWDNIRTQELSLLFQELNLFPELTAFENVKLKNNLTGHKTDEQIKEMFATLEITEKMDSLIGKMSWGQQQRVAVIRCLCQPFSFLILDEPISHLDDVNAKLIAGLITNETSKNGAGVIVTSIGKHLPLDYSQKFAL